MREEVAAHYRSKGYTIRENVKVRGDSGAVHAVDMVAQGPLGNLVIAIEEDLEGPELQAMRRTARDIGATAVIAARRIPDTLRQRASQAGVVMLDEEALRRPPPAEPVPDEPAPAPWPDPERRGGASPGSRKSTDPGFWRYPRGSAQSFSWLPSPAEDVAGTQPQEPGPPQAPGPFDAPSPPAGAAGPASAAQPSPAPRAAAPLHAPVPPAAGAVALAMPWWQWVLGAVVFGAAAGGAFYAFLRIFG